MGYGKSEGRPEFVLNKERFEEEPPIFPVRQDIKAPANPRFKVYPVSVKADGMNYIPAQGMLEQIYAAYRPVTNGLPTGAWRGKRCFVIGGGESLRVFNFSLLEKELSIGVNRIFEVFYPTILYSMDTRFYQWLVDLHLDRFSHEPLFEKWVRFPGHKFYLCPLTYYPFTGGVRVVRRLLNKCVSLDLDHGIYGGNNSGFGALMLAIALGANPIYLLGYDMQIKQNSHFHNGYPGQNDAVLKEKLKSYRELLERFAEPIKELGIRVINLNPGSALKCFEFDTIENVVTKEVPNG